MELWSHLTDLVRWDPRDLIIEHRILTRKAAAHQVLAHLHGVAPPIPMVKAVHRPGTRPPEHPIHLQKVVERLHGMLLRERRILIRIVGKRLHGMHLLERQIHMSVVMLVHGAMLRQGMQVEEEPLPDLTHGEELLQEELGGVEQLLSLEDGAESLLRALQVTLAGASVIPRQAGYVFCLDFQMVLFALMRHR